MIAMALLPVHPPNCRVRYPRKTSSSANPADAVSPRNTISSDTVLGVILAAAGFLLAPSRYAKTPTRGRRHQESDGKSQIPEKSAEVLPTSHNQAVHSEPSSSECEPDQQDSKPLLPQHSEVAGEPVTYTGQICIGKAVLVCTRDRADRDRCKHQYRMPPRGDGLSSSIRCDHGARRHFLILLFS